MLHNDKAAGHLGMAKTLQRVRKRFYWPVVKGAVEACVSSCDQYQKQNGQKQKHRMLMLIWLASKPFYQVSCDFLGPLSNSKGHKYLHDR